ncbi:hypothetical protein D9M73_255670 [compost metagenome]
MTLQEIESTNFPHMVLKQLEHINCVQSPRTVHIVARHQRAALQNHLDILSYMQSISVSLDRFHGFLLNLLANLASHKLLKHQDLHLHSLIR